MSLPDVWLEMEIEPTQEKNTILDNLQEATTIQCEKWQEANDVDAVYDKDWLKLNRHKLRTIVLSVFYSAVDQLSQDGRSVFTCYISEAKDKLRAYLNKQYSVEYKKNYYTINNQDLIDFLGIDGETKVEENKETGDRALLLQIINQLSEVKQAIASAPIDNQIRWFSVDSQFEMPAPQVVSNNNVEPVTTAHNGPVELDRNITLWATHQIDMWWFKMKVQNIQVDPKLLAANKRRKDAKKL